MTLQRDAAPLRSYAGQVKSVDDRGVRIATIDWTHGTVSGIELFVPWSSIASAMVVTNPEELAQFERRAGQWQAQSAALGGGYDREAAREQRGAERVRSREGPKRED
jgi:hypothetical protein